MFIPLVNNAIATVLLNLMFNINTNAYDGYYYQDYYDYYDGPPRFYSGQEVRARKPGARTNKEIMADLLDHKLSVEDVANRFPDTPMNRVQKRNAGVCGTRECFNCLDSCKWLKKSRFAAMDVNQYTYLRLCSEGCKDNIPCIMNNYCLPVQSENPDFFVICVNRCNLFEIVPTIFRTGQCNR